MSSYYEDQYYIDDYFSSIESNAEISSNRAGQNSIVNSSVEAASTNRTRQNNNDSNGGNNGKNKSGNKDDKGKSKKPGPPPPPYFPSQFVRLVNEDEQTSICHESPIIFSRIVDNNGNFIKFQPETGAILLEDKSVFLVIYESQVYSTEPIACNHSLGLHLELDGEHIAGSGTLARVCANEKVELVSHAIITTKEGAPNILQLLNQSGKTINAFGANLTLLKIGEIKDDEMKDN